MRFGAEDDVLRATRVSEPRNEDFSRKKKTAGHETTAKATTFLFSLHSRRAKNIL